MNWLSIVVLLLLVGCAFKGYHMGLIKTIFSLFSIIIALLVTSVIAPTASKLLQNNEKLTSYIEEKVMESIGSEIKDGDTQRKQLEIIDALPLPKAIKQGLSENSNKEVYKALSVHSLQEYVVKYITGLIINAGTFLIIFLIMNIILWVICNILNIISRLPVIHGINKLAGLGVGLLEGLLIVWVLCILLTVFSSTEFAQKAFVMINESPFLNFLYNNNLLLKSVANVMKGFL